MQCRRKPKTKIQDDEAFTFQDNVRIAYYGKTYSTYSAGRNVSVFQHVNNNQIQAMEVCFSIYC